MRYANYPALIMAQHKHVVKCHTVPQKNAQLTTWKLEVKLKLKNKNPLKQLS